ncbi:MAG TPA: protein kinase, partial [Opitutales bacterium]|nr:protein kinase [Opitutales bacterium]
MSQDNDETMLDSSPKGPHKSALKAGDRLGDYVLMRMLGAGAMGQVYLGRQVHLNQTCAIKVLPEELSRSQDFTKRFASEGQALARMDNSSIVRVLNASVDAGRHFMVLEFVDGGDLSEYMHKKGGKLDEAETYDVLSQILDGLAYAHKKNIVHRDLKPANILRTSDGKFKISDFGLALVMDSGFVQDLVRKSIVADKPIDATSDATVYSGANPAPGRGRIDPDATMVAGPSPAPSPRAPAFDPDATMVQGPAPVRPAAFDPDATVVQPPSMVRPQPMKAAFDPDATMVQGPAAPPVRPTAFDPDATMVAGPSTPAPRKPSFDPDATMVAGPSAPAGGGDETVVAGPASGKVPHAESVADAGTVHSTADISGASAFVGTLDYMSPEVRAGQAADARSDIYAIGIMAYQMLTGRKPLGRAKAVSVLRPGLSPTWDEWIDKCLEVETSERFQGAGEALEALKNVRVGSVAQDSPGTRSGTPPAGAFGRTPEAGTAVNVAKNVTAAAKAGAAEADALPKKRSKAPIFIAAAILVVLAGGAGIAINLMKHDGASAPGAPGADSGKAVVQTPPVADDKTGPASSIGTRTDSR